MISSANGGAYIFSKQTPMKQLMLFTLQCDFGTDKDRVIRSMDALESAAAVTLRMVDVGNRFSDKQYVVILLDADMDSAKQVAMRMISKYEIVKPEDGLRVQYESCPLRFHIGEEAKEK